jgi:hypothetical protein
MELRYRGFLRALKYCDLLAVIHPEMVDQYCTHRTPIHPIFPEIGALSVEQRNRLWNLPAGFTMTGTLTPYRQHVAASLIVAFGKAGWTNPVYQYRPFEAPAKTTSWSDKKPESDIKSLEDCLLTPGEFNLSDVVRAEYNAIEPEYLFNLNPAQSENWPYSSPMRILRAIILGQIPVITKKFNDHPIEDVAMLWDGTMNTALDFAMWKFIDRRSQLAGYLHSLETYDRNAREANKPFVDAVMALADRARTSPTSTTASEAIAATDGNCTASRRLGR